MKNNKHVFFPLKTTTRMMEMSGTMQYHDDLPIMNHHNANIITKYCGPFVPTLKLIDGATFTTDIVSARSFLSSNIQPGWSRTDVKR